MGDHHKMLSNGPPNQDEVLLVQRMIWIGYGDRKWIPEGRSSLGKTDTVFAEVSGCLTPIPCETEGHPYT